MLIVLPKSHLFGLIKRHSRDFFVLNSSLWSFIVTKAVSRVYISILFGKFGPLFAYVHDPLLGHNHAHLWGWIFWLLLIPLNQFFVSMTDFHWLVLVFDLIICVIISSRFLLILPRSHLLGFMRRDGSDCLSLNSSLWSFKVIKAFSCVWVSILLHSSGPYLPMSITHFFALMFPLLTNPISTVSAFLYSLVMFSVKSLL